MCWNYFLTNSSSLCPILLRLITGQNSDCQMQAVSTAAFSFGLCTDTMVPNLPTTLCQQEFRKQWLLSAKGELQNGTPPETTSSNHFCLCEDRKQISEIILLKQYSKMLKYALIYGLCNSQPIYSMFHLCVSFKACSASQNNWKNPPTNN